MVEYEVRTVDVYPGADGDDGTFDLAEDEVLLTAEERSPHRLVLQVATPRERADWTCGECGAGFETEHGLKVHEGSQHQ